jgi:hypothetical protein
MNPAEFAIDLVNTDFTQNQDQASQHLSDLQDKWAKSDAALIVVKDMETATCVSGESELEDQGSANQVTIPLTLIHRSFIKSYRDVVAYGIRIAMYTGLAIMMGTGKLFCMPAHQSECLLTRDSVAATRNPPGKYRRVHQCYIFRGRFYVLHGCCVHPSVP